MHYGVAQSGPFRIFPGRLSVSRSFGDAEAKIQNLGGNPNVLISIPEIKSFRIKKETDFILIGCDGIFDKLSNSDVIHSIWSLSTESNLGKNVNEHSGKISDIIIRNCLASNANDNLTCIFICFENFKNLLFENNSFNSDRDKLDEIIKNLVLINQESFLEKENDNFDNELNTPLSNNMQMTNNLNNVNNNTNSFNLKNSQKSILNNINNNNGNNTNESSIYEIKKSKNNLQLNLNLRNHQPNSIKIISPVNKLNISKFLSPTNNTSNNLNQNFLNNNIFNQTMSSNEDGIQPKKIFSNKNVNFIAKLDLISPKNSMNHLNKKQNYNVKVNIEDNKIKSLPAINVSGNAKKANFS